MLTVSTVAEPALRGHRVALRWRLDGSQTYRPYGCCRCGWSGPYRSSDDRAAGDALAHDDRTHGGGRWSDAATAGLLPTQLVR
jgi:hypothetical protein